jgi:hypothetical protein
MATITDNIDSYLVQAQNLTADTADIQDMTTANLTVTRGAAAVMEITKAEATDLTVTNLATVKLIDAQGIEVDSLVIKQNGQIKFTSNLKLASTDQDTLAIINGEGHYGDLELNNLVVKGRIVKSVNEICNMNDIEMIFDNTDNGGFPASDIEIVVSRGEEQDAVIKWDEADKCWKLGFMGAEERIITSGHAEFDADIVSNEKVRFTGADGAPVLAYYNNAFNIESRDHPIHLFSGFDIYANGGKILTTNSVGVDATTIGGKSINELMLSNTVPSLNIGRISEMPVVAAVGSIFMDSQTGNMYQYVSGRWTFIGAMNPALQRSVVGCVSVKTTNYTLQESDYAIVANASSGPITLTLPPAAAMTERMCRIKKSDNTNLVTIAASESETIDGGSIYVMRQQYQSIDLMCDGIGWYIF